MLPNWWPDVFGLLLGYLGFVYTLYQQTWVPKALADSAEASDENLTTPNPLYSTFKTLYLNDQGYPSLSKSFLITTFYLAFLGTSIAVLRGVDNWREGTFVAGSTLFPWTISFLTLNYVCDYFSVFLSLSLLRHFGSKLPGVVIFFLDYILTTVLLVAAIFASVLVLAPTLSPIDVDFFFQLFTIPSLVLFFGSPAGVNFLNDCFVQAGAISAFSSTFWIAAILIYSGLSGQKLSTQVSGSTSAGAFSLRNGAFWIQFTVVTVLFFITTIQLVQTNP